MSIRDDLAAGAASTEGSRILSDRAPSADHDRLCAFFADALTARPIVVMLSRADERRLGRNIAEYNRETPDDPMDPRDDGDLAIALMGCASRGLDDGDDDDGVWSGVDGRANELPRPNRSRLGLRALFAWRAAQRTWRSS